MVSNGGQTVATKKKRAKRKSPKASTKTAIKEPLIVETTDQTETTETGAHMRYLRYISLSEDNVQPFGAEEDRKAIKQSHRSCRKSSASGHRKSVAVPAVDRNRDTDIAVDKKKASKGRPRKKKKLVSIPKPTPNDTLDTDTPPMPVSKLRTFAQLAKELKVFDMNVETVDPIVKTDDNILKTVVAEECVTTEDQIIENIVSDCADISTDQAHNVIDCENTVKDNDIVRDNEDIVDNEDVYRDCEETIIDNEYICNDNEDVVEDMESIIKDTEDITINNEETAKNSADPIGDNVDTVSESVATVCDTGVTVEEDVSANCVRRSRRLKKVTELYSSEEVDKSSRRLNANTMAELIVSVSTTDADEPSKTRSKASKPKAQKESPKSKAEKTPKVAKTSKPKIEKKTKSKRRGSIGGKNIGKLLADYRRRIPEHQKRLKYVEMDPNIDILYKKIGLVSTRLSAIPEAQDECYK
ncbi:unnamed protein product [Medioppia subpectinata]|uniref:Uncharacterized protein n=1 Tax=Medioppia subpectinata TaxID=1979941 RepID=A0A7R9LJS6_9ACAR|nr:unnamed protein product [Medioppia subpectinata]CAG2119442.1 unnamed protein product [Medioppia subpectinata]